jgi:hypothetical protein
VALHYKRRLQLSEPDVNSATMHSPTNRRAEIRGVAEQKAHSARCARKSMRSCLAICDFDKPPKHCATKRVRSTYGISTDIYAPVGLARIFPALEGATNFRTRSIATTIWPVVP